MDYFKKLLVAGLGILAGSTALTVTLTVKVNAESVTTPAVNVLEEIVITARKRNENLQSVPISVTAFDAKAIRKAGFTDSLSIAPSVPNLDIKTFGGAPNVFIRGVGVNDYNASNISPVTIYADDVLMGLTGSQTFQMFDMDRIEVLRGPQGTLFGRNATGGALTFHSVMPGNEFEGFGRLALGTHDEQDIEAGVTIPWAAGAASTRVAVATKSTSGDRINLYTGDHINAVNTKAARAITRFTPSDEVELLWNVHWGIDRSDYREGKPLGTISGANVAGYSDLLPNDTLFYNINGLNRHWADDVGTSLTAVIKRPTFTIKSITAMERATTDYAGDVDESPVRLDQVHFLTSGRQYSEDLNVSSVDSRKLGWIAGIYALHEDFNYHTMADLFGAFPFAVPLNALSQRYTTTWAIYSEAEFHATDRLTLTAGLRYTREAVNANLISTVVPGLFTPGAVPGAPIPIIPSTHLSNTWGSPSGRLILDFKITPDVLSYASISRGFKSGGFNLGAFFNPDEVTTVNPEHLTAYEIGLKSTLLDRRLRANLSAFYYDYKDLQVFTFAQGSTPSAPIVQRLENASNARVYGLEAEFTAVPVSNLELTASVGLLHSQYKDFVSLGKPLSGNQLPDAPKVTANVSADYRILVGKGSAITVRGDYSYSGKKYFDSTQSELISGAGYGLFNARIGFESADGRWQAGLWGRNLLNKDYLVDGTDLSGTFGFVARYYGDRRSMGADLAFHF